MSKVPGYVACAYKKIVNVKDLKPNPDNPNEHSQEQIEWIAWVIKENKIRKSIIVSNQSGLMVTGHGTLQGAKLNEWEFVPVDFQDFESPEKEYAHMVADNELARLARMNRSKINQSILEHGPFDIKLLGMPDFVVEPMERKDLFSENQLNDILGNENYETMRQFNSKLNRELVRRMKIFMKKGIDEDKSTSLAKKSIILTLESQDEKSIIS